MATLPVPVTTDFSALALNNIDIIDFTNAAAAATATFASTQFNNVAILNSVLIDGSAQANHIVVNGSALYSYIWAFANWTDGVDQGNRFRLILVSKYRILHDGVEFVAPTCAHTARICRADSLEPLQVDRARSVLNPALT